MDYLWDPLQLITESVLIEEDTREFQRELLAQLDGLGLSDEASLSYDSNTNFAQGFNDVVKDLKDKQKQRTKQQNESRKPKSSR